jgi:hypothetical protein
MYYMPLLTNGLPRYQGPTLQEQPVPNLVTLMEMDPMPELMNPTPFRCDPSTIECLTLFEDMEGSDPDELVNRMILPPLHAHSPMDHRQFDNTVFNRRMVRNPRRPFTYSHTDMYHPYSFVITDTTRSKKGKIVRPTADRFCYKELRNRTIFVFNIEWYLPTP